MNEKLVKMVLQREKLFVPLLFTEKQMNVLRMHDHRLALSNAEKKALYTSIKKKMNALNSLFPERKGEYFISGAQYILPARLAEAKKLLDEYSRTYERVFVSGSFLFSREFNDIDIFIIRKRGYNEVTEHGRHLIFLSEKKLRNPIFQSTLLISVSSSPVPIKIRRKRPSLSELMTTYHKSVIGLLGDKEKPEAIRRLIFNHSLFCGNRLLDGRELRERTRKITVDELDMLIQELCKKLFSETYLYVEVHDYLKTLEASIGAIRPNTHLVRYKSAYEELIYGRRRGKAE